MQRNMMNAAAVRIPQSIPQAIPTFGLAFNTRDDIDHVWEVVVGQFRRGSLEATLESNVWNALSAQGVADITKRLSVFLKCPVCIFYDNAYAIMRLMPIGVGQPGPLCTLKAIVQYPTVVNDPQLQSIPQYSEELHDSPQVETSSAVKMHPARNPRAKVARSRLSKVPRPPNAFILFRKSHHEAIKVDNPGIHNNEISKLIGSKWNNETEAVKDLFRQKAAEAKRKHEITYPGYYFDPRKPTDKKRRPGKAVQPISKHIAIPEFFKDSNNPARQFRDFQPGQTGLFDQMADIHNMSGWNSGLFPRAAHRNGFDDAHLTWNQGPSDESTADEAATAKLYNVNNLLHMAKDFNNKTALEPENLNGSHDSLTGPTVATKDSDWLDAVAVEDNRMSLYHDPAFVNPVSLQIQPAPTTSKPADSFNLPVDPVTESTLDIATQQMVDFDFELSPSEHIPMRGYRFDEDFDIAAALAAYPLQEVDDQMFFDQSFEEFDDQTFL